MSAYKYITIVRRSDSATLSVHEHTTDWSVRNHKLKGCGRGTFTVEQTGGALSTLDNFLQLDNRVDVSIYFGSPAYSLTYSGYIDQLDEPGGTAPNNVLRGFTTKGGWWQLTDGGVRVLTYQQNITAQSLMMSLLGSKIAPHCDVALDFTRITAGAGWTIAETLYEDDPAADYIEEIARLAQNVVYGVDHERRLYFVPEDTTTVKASVVCGTLADGISLFKRESLLEGGGNYFVLKGRDAPSGNAVSRVVMADAVNPDSGSYDATVRRRDKVIDLPSLIYGSDIVRYGGYLVDKDTGEAERNDLAFTRGDLLIPSGAAWQCEDLNGLISVTDSDGNPQSTPMHSITYSQKPGETIRVSLEIGDKPPLDVFDTSDIKELIRKVAIHESSRFANSIELASENRDWARHAYITMVGHDLRNSWRPEIKDVKKSGSIIDWDHGDTSGIRRTSEPIGITSRLTGLSEYGTFVTKEFPVRGDFKTWAVLRNLDGKVFFGGGTKDMDSYFEQYNDGAPSLFWTDTGGYISPLAIAAGPANDFDGRLRGTIPVSHDTSIIWTFKWGLPHGDGSDSYCRRYLLHNYENNGNHYRVLLKHSVGSPSRLEIGFEKVINGTVTVHGSGYRYVYLDTDDDEIRVTLSDIDIWAYHRYKITVENLSNGQETSFTTDVNWLELAADMNRYGYRAWLNNAPISYPYDNDYLDTWKIQTLGFADSTAHATSFELSRDGGVTWEGLYSADTGQPKELGLTGTITETAILKGRVAFPQILTGLAVGFG